MSPLIASGLFIANTLMLSLTLSVLMLALSQHPGDTTGRAVTQFLVALSFYNFTVMALLLSLIFNLSWLVLVLIANIGVEGFALCTIASFSLVVSLAGKMKEIYQVTARAGMVIFLLIQWPLWTGKFFVADLVNRNPLASYTTAGIIVSLVDLFYIAMCLILAWVNRKRVEPTISFGVGLLMLGQIIALLNPTLREIGVSSLAALVATGILGYRLVRMQLFNPFMMQKTQLAALRDVSQALIGTQELQGVLKTVVQQSRRLLNSDLAMIFVQDEDKGNGANLVVGAQDGGTISLIGRELPVGQGLSGTVFVRKEALHVKNYQSWAGQSSVFADVKFKASISVPLVYDDDVVGVLNVSALKPGRVFSDRDQALLEMLAPQAAVAIVNTRLRQRIILLQQNRQSS